jgi:hypothetical protein
MSYPQTPTAAAIEAANAVLAGSRIGSAAVVPNHVIAYWAAVDPAMGRRNLAYGGRPFLPLFAKAVRAANAARKAAE